MPSRPIWKNAGPVVKATVNGDSPVKADIGTSNNQNIVDITGAGQIVAVYDSGLDAGVNGTLRAFNSSLVIFDQGTDNDDLVDITGHGTHVAGTIAHEDNSAQTGLARGVKLIIQREGGHPFKAALAAAYSAGARIHNNSWSTTYEYRERWKWTETWLNRSRVGSTTWSTLPVSEKYTGRSLGDRQGLFPRSSFPSGPLSTKTSDGVHSDFKWSWRDASRYDDEAVDADKFAAGHRDFVIVAGASNEGPGLGTIGSLGTAKNVITVGSCRNDLPSGREPNYTPKRGIDGDPSSSTDPVHPDRMSGFSSRGPTEDGRIKPDVVAPGEGLLAPLSQSYDPDNVPVKMRLIRGSKGNQQKTYGTTTTQRLYEFVYSSGTSMATPVVSSCVALVREWLARKHSLTAPSSSLVKALLINGADRLPAFKWGDEHQGWGRVNLQNVFDPRGGRLLCWSDEVHALAQGKTAEFSIDLAGHKPGWLKITLVWLDPPGAVAQKTSDRLLVNNLDLHVEAPSGQWYAGNSFNTGGTASEPHNSQQTGDAVNNVECVILTNVDHSSDNSAVYKIYVVAKTVASTSVGAQHTNLNAAAQSFALVVSGVKANTTLQGQVY